MAAVARYFTKLQEAQNLTAKAISEKVGVSDRIVSAWLKGEHSPKLDYIPALLKVLRGAWEDVERLMRDEATVDEATRLAEARLSRDDVVAELAKVAGDTPAEGARFTRFLDLLADGVDPQEAAAIVRREG